MNRNLLNSALFAVVLSTFTCTAESQPVLITEAGRYIGGTSADQKVEHFLGVPFAVPPTGARRWMAPEPLPADNREVQATTYAPACYQGDHIVDWYQGVMRSFGGDPEAFSAPQVNEDCLYLNIWRPAEATMPLPVMVFVHGGSNKGGWSYEPNYIGETLARKNALVVTIAYRLGPFGFLSHPDQPISNFGLLDIVMALSWVQENIAASGGDPSNVTVFGESAGASNIAFLLAMDEAAPLFQNIVLQSSGWAFESRSSRSEHLALSGQLQHRLTPDSTRLDALRALPADVLMDAALAVYDQHFFDPVIDGVTLSQSPYEALSMQDIDPPNVLIGSNGDEWLMYLENEDTPDSWVERSIPSSGMRAAIKREIETIQNPEHALDRLITATNYVCPSMALASRVVASGGSVWFYLFDRTRPGTVSASMGAYHGAELPYVFNTHDDWLPTDSSDLRLSEQMGAAWVNFARSGSPGTVGNILWPAYDNERKQVLVFDDTLRVEEHRDRALCALIRG